MRVIQGQQKQGWRARAGPKAATRELFWNLEANLLGRGAVLEAGSGMAGPKAAKHPQRHKHRKSHSLPPASGRGRAAIQRGIVIWCSFCPGSRQSWRGRGGQKVVSLFRCQCCTSSLWSCIVRHELQQQLQYMAKCCIAASSKR